MTAPTRPALRRTLRPRVWLRRSHELLASMRFAIALLCVICMASVIGTVIRQGEPLNNYHNQFGPFWAEVLGRFDLYTVYSAPWFLLILGFLVVSTSLCIARNLPKIMADWRHFKEGVRAASLLAFHHHAQGARPGAPDAVAAQVAAQLQDAGWRIRSQVREDGTMLAARKGRANKLGYLAAHGAVVLICLGGLTDGNLIIKLQMALQGKQLYSGSNLSSEVDERHRLGLSNPTYRGNLFVPEGMRAGTAVLNMPGGIVLQDLPFDVELKKFIVEYYDTGMPRLFASQIVLHDRDTGAATPATVEVNHPVEHRGVMIYQASFDDGGSAVTLKSLPLHAGEAVQTLAGRIGQTLSVTGPAGQPLGVELTGLKVINVENLSGAEDGATDVRKVDLQSRLHDTLQDHLGSGAPRPGADKHLRNVGPALTYKLIDAAGQRREFHAYMQPMQLDGQSVFLLGVRDSLDEAFRYLRIPADEQMTTAGWLRLRNALLQPAARERAAAAYAVVAAPQKDPAMREQLQATAARALALFAGAEPASDSAASAPASRLASQPVPMAERNAGLAAFSRFIEANVPAPERERMSQVLLRVLEGALATLNDQARQDAGLEPLAPTAESRAFITQSLLSLSDSFFYPAPLLFTLDGFEQVQASVFQVARAPGKTLVYLGAVLLILGVFAMLYVRERRLWVWLTPAHADLTAMTLAMSTPRRTLDADAEFEQLRSALGVDQSAAQPSPPPPAASGA